MKLTEDKFVPLCGDIFDVSLPTRGTESWTWSIWTRHSTS